MKIAFSVLNANAAVAYITIENQNFLLKEIKGLCSSFQVSQGAARTRFTLAIPQVIQGAGDTTAGVAADLVTLDNDMTIGYVNLKRVTIYTLKAGQVVLLPYDIAPAVPTVPSSQSQIVDGTDDQIFAATHWPYITKMDTDLIGQSSVANCISMDINSNALVQQARNKQARDMRQDAQLALSTGLNN